MTRSKNRQFAIALSEHLAAQVNTLCEADGLSYSDFFCEAALADLAAESCELQYVMPTSEGEFMYNPAHIFSEWDSTADCVYDTLR